MLDLSVYPPGFGEISASPFAVKALCLMEMSGVEYSRRVTPDPRSAPKRKLPVLDHDGTLVPDSDQIRGYLETRFSVDFDKGLSDAQKTTARAVIRMVEEHLYFAIVSNRWQQEQHWPSTRAEFFGGMPALLMRLVSGQVRKGVIRQLDAQGMGRHSVAEQVDRVRCDIKAIEVLLGDQPFLFGDAPTSADASVVPMLRAVAFFPVSNPLSDLVLERPLLMDYVARGKAAMYPKDAD